MRLTVMAFVTYVLIAAKSAGLSVAATQSMVALSLIGMALCTGLQAYGGRWQRQPVGAHAQSLHGPIRHCSGRRRWARRYFWGGPAVVPDRPICR